MTQMAQFLLGLVHKTDIGRSELRMKNIGINKLTRFFLVLSCAIIAVSGIAQLNDETEERTASFGLTEDHDGVLDEILKVYNKTHLNEDNSTGLSEIKYWESFKEDGVNYGLKIRSSDPSNVIVSLTKVHDDSTWYKFSKAYMDGSELKFLTDTVLNENFELTKGFNFKKEWADFSVNTEVLIEKSCEDVGANFAVLGKRRLKFTVPKQTLQGFLTKAKRLGADIGKACLEIEIESEEDATPREASLEQHAFKKEDLEPNS